MVKLYLVRHGKAAASWDAAHNPGLDHLGREQANAAAQALAPLGPMSIVSSPLARALETSRPLARIWGSEPTVEARVGEIQSPLDSLPARTEWLRMVMGKEWSNLGRELRTWRRGVIEALCRLGEDTVVFTHFIAINAAVGEATGDGRVVCFWPENGSVTRIRNNGTSLELIERGKECLTSVG